MKKLSLLTTAAILCAGTILYTCEYTHSAQGETGKLEEKMKPAEHFFFQRSFPDTGFDYRAYRHGLLEMENALTTRNSLPGFNNQWTSQGPGNIGSRVNTLAIHPHDNKIIYAGYAHGGIFKTENGGRTWRAIFDEQAFLSIGDIAIDPSNPNTVYAGTGDVNIPSGYFIGNGIYKSEDGGESWENTGLNQSGIISKIIVHPNDSDILFAGVMGIPSVKDSLRGLYRSTNGGTSWECVLFVADQAGIIDMVINPVNPRIIYAAAWDRHRTNFESLVSGPNAAIYKSEDGGTSWRKLTNGLPERDMGRIGLSISPDNPDILTAVYVGTNNHFSAIYKTVDGGASWMNISTLTNFQSVGESSPLGGFGWYFGKIRMNPKDDKDIFLLGVDLWRSRDNGATWLRATPPWWTYDVHADKHDLIIRNDTLYLATDGGIYRMDLATNTWQDIENNATTQFYRVAYNPHQPQWYYGGAQDNGTSGGNAFLINEWWRIWGGDGFQPAFHPDDPDIFYVETQDGNITVTTNGGLSVWNAADKGIENDRKNWDMPYMLSPHNPDILYAGTYRIMKSTAGVIPDFTPLTTDLTSGIEERYYNISTVDESVLQQDLLYAGTSDGKVWRADGATGEATDISNGLPNRYVTSVKASPNTESTVFVTHSGYKYNEYIPRVHRSTSRGGVWEDISSNLPDLVVNDIFILPGGGDSILFAGTDGGVYGTLDGGQYWERLGTNMPIIPVFDMVYNVAKNELVAGTYARSVMSYSLSPFLPSGNVDIPASSPKPVQLRVFPNPASDFINIKFLNNEPGKNAEIAIVNADGALVFFENTGDRAIQNYRVETGDFPKGIYFVKVKIRHQIRTAKLIIQ